ncbi:transmembrane protein 272-like [Odontesthes bonariensis]|uniref:transmembrane protein 272-like n=1 Tax=Odontesthes bonariensis TaxID=219752 RepID=UPI003F58EC31
MPEYQVVVFGKLVLGCSALFTFIMSIANISIGAVYLNDCPQQPYIPIYLIVVGVFGLVLAVLSCLPFAPNLDGCIACGACIVLNSLISSFLFCWFIAGNVWIYSIYEPNYNKNTTNVDPYCDKTVYLFAFWTTTLVYILSGFYMFIGCYFFFWFYFCPESCFCCCLGFCFSRTD